MAVGGNAHSVANINGYTTPIGNRALAVRTLSWPDIADFLSGPGFPIDKQTFGLRGIDTAWAGISASGAYIVLARISGGAGSQTVNFLLFDATTGAPIANHAAVTADSVTIGVIGG